MELFKSTKVDANRPFNNGIENLLKLQNTIVKTVEQFQNNSK